MTTRNFDVRFHGGPIAGELRAYPSDPGRQIRLQCVYGEDSIYQKDESQMAAVHLAETGEHVYECVQNGAAKPLAELLKKLEK